MLDGMTAPDQSAPEKASDQGQDTTTLQASKDEGAEAGETGEPKDASAKEANETGDVLRRGRMNRPSRSAAKLGRAAPAENTGRLAISTSSLPRPRTRVQPLPATR